MKVLKRRDFGSLHPLGKGVGSEKMVKRDKEPASVPADMQERVAKTLAMYRSTGRPLATPARAATPPPDPAKAEATPTKTSVAPTEPPSSTPLRSPEYKRAKAQSLQSLPSADTLPRLPQFAPADPGLRHVDTQSTIDAGILEQMSQISISEASGPSGLPLHDMCLYVAITHPQNTAVPRRKCVLLYLCSVLRDH